MGVRSISSKWLSPLLASHFCCRVGRIREMRLIGASCFESPTRTTRREANNESAATAVLLINPASSMKIVVNGASPFSIMLRIVSFFRYVVALNAVATTTRFSGSTKMRLLWSLVDARTCPISLRVRALSSQESNIFNCCARSSIFASDSDSVPCSIDSRSLSANV